MTFEELNGMFIAKDIDFGKLKASELKNETSADGRGFAVMGGVAQAVVNACAKIAPDREIKVYAAQGLDNCRKMLKDAVEGKFDGYLLEGMACPSGCVSGAGTITSANKAKSMVGLSQKEATKKNSTESEYIGMLPKLD